MRIIFFNIWYGTVWNKLKTFIETNKDTTDIYCFIESSQDIHSKVNNICTNFNSVFDKGGWIKYHGGIFDSQSIFYKSNLKLLSSERIEIYTPTDQDASGLVALNFETNTKQFWVGNVHGTARPGNKLDTPVRLKQSHKIIKSFNDKNLPVVIGGDFNLMPVTESIKMFEEVGYRNLIKEFGIKNTRNKLCWNQFPEEVAKYGKQYFADYCFVSPEVKVLNFSVPNIEASDHEPLILDFEIA